MHNLKSLKHKLILIGASTGGPGHIQKIVASLSFDFNASIVIAQHMGDEYLQSFAKLLDEKCRLPVFLVEDGMCIEPSSVYICSKICTLNMHLDEITFSKKRSEKPGFNPDINMLFNSATSFVENIQMLGVILTGIGSDGAEGCFSLVNSGALCIAESQKSAVVFGMPKKAKELSSDVKVKELDEIIKEIKRFGS